MIVSLIQLFCDGDHGIKIHYPEDGPVDGAIVTPFELRLEARKAGWGRKRDGLYGFTDQCPQCAAQAKKEEKGKAR
jgi:hypothetical protein